jgi:hypothetical protein
VIICKGYKDEKGDLQCEYEPQFPCGDCVLIGGDMSPRTGKKFRGNKEPYIEAFRKPYKKYRGTFLYTLEKPETIAEAIGKMFFVDMAK